MDELLQIELVSGNKGTIELSLVILDGLRLPERLSHSEEGTSGRLNESEKSKDSLDTAFSEFSIS